MAIEEVKTGKFTIYATFGFGQPNAPGYFSIEVDATDIDDAKDKARERMNSAVGRNWCMLYSSLDSVHVSDRIFRGKA